MDLKKFKKISEAPVPRLQLVWQDWKEWQSFLEFASGYFKNRGVENPLVVEIGVMHNEQRIFYKELLGASHIGIDLNANNAPDIIGDSADPQTLKKLKEVLAGREIDLLFIDGNHTYEGVRKDYELYAPLVRHLVVFHDVHGVTRRCAGINPYWEEVTARNTYMTLVFHRYGKTVSIERNEFVNMGVGVIIKG